MENLIFQRKAELSPHYFKWQNCVIPYFLRSYGESVKILVGITGLSDFNMKLKAFKTRTCNTPDRRWRGSNAGADIAVTTSMTLAGTAAANYSLTQPTGLKATIAPKAIPEDAIQTIAAQSQTFDNTPKEPALTVNDGSRTLVLGTNYTGTATANFFITEPPPSSSSITP
jgi:hypothetical protein